MYAHSTCIPVCVALCVHVGVYSRCVCVCIHKRALACICCVFMFSSKVSSESVITLTPNSQGQAVAAEL